MDATYWARSGCGHFVVDTQSCAVVLETGLEFPVPTLAALVQMKLTASRLKDKADLLDLLDVRMIDESWCHRADPGDRR